MILCQVSGVICHLLRVTYHQSHVINANSHSHGPSPYSLPEYAADLDLDPSTMSHKDRKINFFPHGDCWPFLRHKLQILSPMSFPYFSLGNRFVIDQCDVQPLLMGVIRFIQKTQKLAHTKHMHTHTQTDIAT